MDEADVLCSRIAIMAKGRMLCIAPPQVLKSRFGGNYMLHINYSPAHETEARAFVKYDAAATCAEGRSLRGGVAPVCSLLCP